MEADRENASGNAAGICAAFTWIRAGLCGIPGDGSNGASPVHGAGQDTVCLPSPAMHQYGSCAAKPDAPWMEIFTQGYLPADQYLPPQQVAPIVVRSQPPVVQRVVQPPQQIVQPVQRQIVERVVRVPVERVVEKIVQVPVEKIVERVVHVPVERVVEVERPVPVSLCPSGAGTLRQFLSPPPRTRECQ